MGVALVVVSRVVRCFERSAVFGVLLYLDEGEEGPTQGRDSVFSDGVAEFVVEATHGLRDDLGTLDSALGQRECAVLLRQVSGPDEVRDRLVALH